MASPKACEKLVSVSGGKDSKVNKLIQLANELTNESIINLDLQPLGSVRQEIQNTEKAIQEIGDLLNSYKEQATLKIRQCLNELAECKPVPKAKQSKNGPKYSGRGRPKGLPGTNLYYVKEVLKKDGPISIKQLAEVVKSTMTKPQVQGCINALVTKREIKNSGKYDADGLIQYMII